MPVGIYVYTAKYLWDNKPLHGKLSCLNWYYNRSETMKICRYKENL